MFSHVWTRLLQRIVTRILEPEWLRIFMTYGIVPDRLHMYYLLNGSGSAVELQNPILRTYKSGSESFLNCKKTGSGSAFELQDSI
jgi:hypothetical protein